MSPAGGPMEIQLDEHRKPKSVREHACLLLEALGFPRDEVFAAEIHMEPDYVEATVSVWKRDERGRHYAKDGEVARETVRVRI